MDLNNRAEPFALEDRYRARSRRDLIEVRSRPNKLNTTNQASKSNRIDSLEMSMKRSPIILLLASVSLVELDECGD